jgi:flagellar hook protein FlgE
MYITPLSGMQYAQSQVERSAAKIAATPSQAAESGAQDSVDLSAEMVALMEAQNNFAANAKALSIMDETAQSTLSIIG